MCHVCASITTNNIASVLANETVFIPLSWCVAFLGTFKLIFFWSLFGHLFAWLDLSTISLWKRFLLKLTLIWFWRVLLNRFTNLAFQLLFFFGLRWLEVLYEFTFLLVSLPSTQSRLFYFLLSSRFLSFRFFWTFFLLTDGKLVSCLLKHL